MRKSPILSTSYPEYLETVQSTKGKLVVMELGTGKSEAYQFLKTQLDWAAQRFGDQVLVITVDYMVVPQIYWDIQCPHIPCVVIFRDGVVIDAFESDMEWEVEQRIQKALEGEEKVEVEEEAADQ